MERDLDGKQFTCVELSFIRFCMDRIIWSMLPNEIYGIILMCPMMMSDLVVI